ncbi:MAG: transposase [Actinobacteria bacterium]|nr:transposase [Actinomycetota bacterium]
MSTNVGVLSRNTKQYRRRKPQHTPYYQCIEDHYEQFKRSYDRNFSKKYGYLRSHIEKVIFQYLDCGILHNGFARIRCECGHEKLLAFSCKRRHFCPSCHAKRVLEFGEWLCSNILKKVPHRHFVFSMPKILRIYFLFNRNLLKEISRISWETVKEYYRSTCRKEGANSAAVAVIQTFGDYLSYNPHVHILAADGCFSNDGFFYAPSINIDMKSIEKLFIHKIFKMLLSKNLITANMVDLIHSWRHTGFSTYCGKRINPKDKRSTENLARYIIRASFSQERMKYYPDEAKVTYQSKYGKEIKEFGCLEWMAALVSHIPDKGGQTVRYLGYYSNVTRGRLKKEDGEPEFHIIEDECPGKLNRSWARLIQKVYEVDPLTCSRCGGQMRIIAFIEDYKIVKKILDYLGIYEFGKKRAPPKIDTSPGEFDEYSRDDYIDCDYVC